MLNCYVNKILTFNDKRVDSYDRENVDFFNFFTGILTKIILCQLFEMYNFELL